MLKSGESKEVVDTAQALLGFLRNVGVGLDKVSRADVVEGGESEVEQRNNRLDFKSILQRYLMFQQLRKENPHLMLIPTADIEYAWICHVLRTEQYWADCVREGIPIAHSLMPLRQADALMSVAAARATSLLWRERFGGVEVPTSVVEASASNDMSQPPPDVATGQCNASDLTFSSFYLPPNDEEIFFQHQFIPSPAALERSPSMHPIATSTHSAHRLRCPNCQRRPRSLPFRLPAKERRRKGAKRMRKRKGAMRPSPLNRSLISTFRSQRRICVLT
jgi:hypothetical protein